MNLLTNITLSITLSLLMISGYHFQFARDTPQIITVDVNQLIEERIRILSTSGNDELRNKEAIRQFGQAIERNIKQLALQDNVVVLPAQAVLAGGNNITQQFKQRMAAQ